MKYRGRARKAAFKLIGFTFAILLLIVLASYLAVAIGSAVVAFIEVLLGLWILFTLFTLYFFRDPNARVPTGAKLVLSPGHGKVDVIDTCSEPSFMDGECQRISMFLSVIDVHVQNAPVSGKVSHFKYNAGQFLSALKTECAAHNENMLLGFEAAQPPIRSSLHLAASDRG